MENDLLVIKLVPKEVDLIYDLLNVETILQLRETIDVTEDKGVLLTKTISIFEVFMDFKDKLSNLKADLIDAQKAAGEAPEKQPVVILSRKMIKLFALLCKETTKTPIPTEVKGLFEDYGRELIAKIDESLVSQPISLEKSLKKRESIVDQAFEINILNSKASA